MARLRGRGLGMGIALGTAAVVRVSRGIPLRPEPSEKVAQQIAFGRLTEKPEVILVAADYRIALAVADTLEWAHVIGIAAQTAEVDAPVLDFPAIVDVPGLLDVMEEGMLMLVDAERGIVLADPDGLSIAQYQQERTNISPKRRLYLDEAHQPAQTREGRPIQVIAITATQEDVTRALEEGADGLYLPFDSTLLPAKENDSTLHRRLFRLVDQTAGKPLILSDDYALPLLTVLEAATYADLTLAVPPREDLDGLGIAEWRQELEEGLNVCFENETPCVMPRLAADFLDCYSEIAPTNIERLAAGGATRLVFSLERGGPTLEALLPQLDALFVAASENLLPILFHLMAYRPQENGVEDDLDMALQMLIGAGVAGILTSAPARIKSRLRELSYTECRAHYFRAMRTEAGFE